MQTITLYLGLDVYMDSTTIAIAEPGSKGEIRLFGTILNSVRALERALSRIRHILFPSLFGFGLLAIAF